LKITELRTERFESANFAFEQFETDVIQTERLH
jgi:hypothetical protein